MSRKLLHIFRNNPLGRENLLQSVYLCQKVPELELHVHFPEHTQCLLMLETGVLTLDLDVTYTKFRETAEQRATEILSKSSVLWHKVVPEKFTSAGLDQLPGDWDVLACPRVISESLHRIGLGRLGRKVRSLIQLATFPVFIPSLCERRWDQVVGFFGGSDLALRAVKQALSLAEQVDVPVTIFTQRDEHHEVNYRERLEQTGVLEWLNRLGGRWVVWNGRAMEENLWDVPPSALAVVGAADSSPVREFFFGSKFELIQRTLPNPLLVIGPKCTRLL